MQDYYKEIIYNVSRSPFSLIKLQRSLKELNRENIKEIEEFWMGNIKMEIQVSLMAILVELQL